MFLNIVFKNIFLVFRDGSVLVSLFIVGWVSGWKSGNDPFSKPSMRNANRANEGEISVTQRFGDGLEPTVIVGFRSAPRPARPIARTRTDLLVHPQSLTSLSTRPTRAALVENFCNGTCEKVTHIHPKNFFKWYIHLFSLVFKIKNGKSKI